MSQMSIVSDRAIPFRTPNRENIRFTVRIESEYTPRTEQLEKSAKLQLRFSRSVGQFFAPHSGSNPRLFATFGAW